MSKRLISITNDGSIYFNYHAWMKEINEVLATGYARVVNVTCPNKDYSDATAWIEIDEPKKK